MGYIKCILKCFNNFSLKIQISLRKYFFNRFLAKVSWKYLALQVQNPYSMDIIRFILNNDTNPCDNMNISLFGKHHNEERTNISTCFSY